MDGYIAKLDGSVDWLHSAGNQEVDLGSEDMGFSSFLNSVDCIVMGRKCMEAISQMNLSEDQWPYRYLPIVVLSKSISEPPENLKGKVSMYSGEISQLMSSMEKDGYKHAYIDGGTTIQSFIKLKLINELTITKAPILLGEGIPLFGPLLKPINLEKAQCKTYPNDFVQEKYKVKYN